MHAGSRVLKKLVSKGGEHVQKGTIPKIVGWVKKGLKKIS